MTKYHHKESDLQIRCVKYFRVKYPAFARLLEHPKNEGSGHSARDRASQAIAKAEGVQAGVADLIFHCPSYMTSVDGVPQEEPAFFFSLAIEMKDKNGRQSPEQKLFQRYFEAAGGRYLIIRSFESFCKDVDEYMAGIPFIVKCNVETLHKQIDQERTAAAREELQRIIHKND